MGRVQWNAVNAVHYNGRPVSFETSRKKNGTLKIFTGGSEQFEMWHVRMVDHIAQINPMWRTILEWLGTSTRMVTKAEGLTSDCLSVNCWAFSVMLEHVLILWIGDTLYKNRLCLCNREPANGFEIWRKLMADNRGGGCNKYGKN